MDDLRNSPMYKAHPDPSSYGPEHRPGPKQLQSDGLPIGTQQRFLSAAAAAANLGSPLQTLLTVRLTALLLPQEPVTVGLTRVCEHIHRFVERLTKWMRRNSLPTFYIWVRECSTCTDEHLHLCLHVPRRHRASLVAFLEKQFHDPVRCAPRSAHVRTEGEFACSESGSWHLAEDTRADRKGHFLAGYLGKGEPSERMFRGRMISNIRKPVRGRAYGGMVASEKYDLSQGSIVGTSTRQERLYISRALHRAMRKGASSKP
jgi:hypothetical protein